MGNLSNKGSATNKRAVPDEVSIPAGGSVTDKENDFHEHVKLTFDALRNSAIAAAIFAASIQVSSNTSYALDILFLQKFLALLLFIFSLILQGLNIYSYSKKSFPLAKSKILFKAGSVTFSAIVLYVYFAGVIFLAGPADVLESVKYLFFIY
ncbi:hypothetical protein [Pseudoalteromonas gelatinilytica]